MPCKLLDGVTFGVMLAMTPYSTVYPLAQSFLKCFPAMWQPLT